jgi:hypothetical protein
MIGGEIEKTGDEKGKLGGEKEGRMMKKVRNGKKWSGLRMKMVKWREISGDRSQGGESKLKGR